MTDDRELLDEGTSAIDASVARVATEFREGLLAVERVHRPAVALFGSARLAPGSGPYESARAVGRRFGEAGWSVVTGGGGGVMEGANRGAREGGGQSVGFNIALPHEQHANRYLDVEYTFDHFYARKVSFVRPAEGFVIFPGGFGTLDELFEALVLIQTGKIRSFPVVLFDASFWGGLVDWARERLLAGGLVSPDDVELLHVTDDPDEAVAIVVDCYVRRCAESPAAPFKEDAQ